MFGKGNDKEETDHLDKEDFNQLADEVKKTTIAHKMSDHLMSCEACAKLSQEFSMAVTKHIEELEKLT